MPGTVSVRDRDGAFEDLYFRKYRRRIAWNAGGRGHRYREGSRLHRWFQINIRSSNSWRQLWIHRSMIATAFQLAGHPHVIGTLWQINDHIADVFYQALSPDDDAMDISRAAHALHHAVRAARDAHPATPSLLAAHIHMGA